MALNARKLQLLQADIEGLEINKGLAKTVDAVKKDIFDLFVDTKVRVNDKQSVKTLSKGLSDTIKSFEKKIDTKADTDLVEGQKVSDIKKNIVALQKQVDVLQNMKNIIEGINTPPYIATGALAKGVLQTSLESKDIVQDFAQYDIKPSENASVLKKDNDRHSLKIKKVSGGRYQVAHDAAIVAYVEFDTKTNQWKLNVQEDMVKKLHITSFVLPMIVSHDIKLTGLSGTKGKTSVTKQKTWQVDLDSWDYTPEPVDNPVEPEKEKDGTETVEEIVDETKSQIVDVFAHVMDKESLVHKSIEQDVLEEYQHKYAKRRWPRRMAMYTYGRIMQNSRINGRMRAARAYGDAIENDAKRQQRISSSIANFAYEADLGLVDESKVQKTELAHSDTVNAIADQYIKGTIDRVAAVEQFNDFFANNADYATGMTGTDIMEQLDDIAFMIALEDSVKPADKRTPADYRKMQTVISNFYSTHPHATLQTVHISNPSAVSENDLNKISDAILAYRSKVAVDKLNNITANVKLYKIEKDTNDLTQSKLREHNKNWMDTILGLTNGATFGLAGSTRGRAALKTMTGASLAMGGVPALGVVGGVAAAAALLQGMKTYRDYLTEAQKTHEDAMTMGTAELDKRIKELEAQIKKHGMLQKTMAFWGFGKHAIRTKQLSILKAVNDKMHTTGAMKSAAQLMQDMKQINKNLQATAIVETLARVQVGRELDTNFISGSSRGLTETERKDLLIQLRESSKDWAKKVGYAHTIPDTHAPSTEWKNFWANVLLGDPNIKNQYDRKCEMLKKAFADMKDDINKGRRNMAARDMATNLATSATIAGVSAGVSTLIGGHGWVPGKSGVNGSGPHNEYAIGKYDQTISPGSVTDKASGRDTAFHNGDKVSFTGESSVDAIHATSKTFGNIASEVSSTETLAKAFDSTTQAAVHNALTTELARVKAEALSSGADAGNVALAQQRWIDGVEEILTKFTVHGKTGITIEEIKFDPSTFSAIDIHKSVAGATGDIVDRAVAFDAKVDGVWGHYDMGDPLWVVWPGFSNTYAVPGKMGDQSDSWSKTGKEDEGRVWPWSEKAKQRKDRAKQIKEHEKLMQTNKDYRDAADRYEQTRKHEEDMKKLLERKKQQLRDIDASIQSIKGDQDKIEELQKKKKDLDEEMKNIQANIDKDAEKLYNNQKRLEKIISGKKTTEKQEDDLSMVSKRDIDRPKESPSVMTDAEVAKRWQYDEEFDKKLTSPHTEKTLAGNIKAVQGLSDADWQQLNANAKLIHDRYTTQTAKLKLESSVWGKDEAWTRWHLAKELSYAKGTNTQSNSTKYPVFDPTQTISDTNQQRIIDTHVGWEAQTQYQAGKTPRYVRINNSLDAKDRPRFQELLAKDNNKTHSREFAELGRLMTAKVA